MHHNLIVAEKHHGKKRDFVVKPYTESFCDAARIDNLRELNDKTGIQERVISRLRGALRACKPSSPEGQAREKPQAANPWRLSPFL